MFDTKPGTRVLITRDIRDIPNKRDGQIGIYEGDFPLTVLMDFGGGVKEYDYESFMRWNAEQEYPIPSVDEAKLSGDPHWKNRLWYVVMENPRIRLPDGSCVWGAECWWGPAEGAPPLEEAQAQTDAFAGAVAAVMLAERTADS